MHKITFHCRTISPMFLSGPDTDEAELRAPSIKGALRFWVRAISLGWPYDKQGDESHKRLLKQDESLFGGVTEAHGRSLVELSVRCGEMISLNRLSNKYWGYVRGIRGKLEPSYKGIAYLLFSLFVHQKDRKGIDEGYSFEVKLRSKDKEALDKAIAAFWGLTYFGALGTRARRGAGTFEVYSTTGYNLPEGISFNPSSHMASFLGKGLKAAWDIFGVEIKSKLFVPQTYSTLGDIWVSRDSFEEWGDALDDIGQRMFKLRMPKRPNPKYSNKKPRFTQKTLNQKAAFGLPVSVQNQDNVVNFKEQKGKDGESKAPDRRASPVWITLARGHDGIYWIVSKLEGEFSETGKPLFFENDKKRTFPWEKVDDTVLDEFFRKVHESSIKVVKTP